MIGRRSFLRGAVALFAAPAIARAASLMPISAMPGLNEQSVLGINDLLARSLMETKEIVGAYVLNGRYLDASAIGALLLPGAQPDYGEVPRQWARMFAKEQAA